jgi:hypothetical protein
VSTPKAEGVEAQTRDLDLSVIHQKLLQGCYATGTEVEADINKVLQTALEKEGAAPPSKSGAGAARDGRPGATSPKLDADALPTADEAGREGGAPTAAVRDRSKPMPSAAAAAAAARAFLQHLPALIKAERENTLAAASGTPSGVGSRMVSVSAHIDGLSLAPAAASTRAGVQLERGWLGSTLRTRPLGRDRLNRQYWWFDWPQGWLAVEACPADYRLVAGEKIVAPPPSSKSKPSRAKPPGENVMKRPLTGASAVSVAASAAAASSSSKSKKTKGTPEPAAGGPGASSSSGAPQESSDATALRGLAGAGAGGNDADPLVVDMEEDDDDDEGGECKACLGMHRAHTCTKHEPTAAKRKPTLAPPPPPPLPPPSAVGKEGIGNVAVERGSGGAASKRAKPKFKVPLIKELSPYHLGTHLSADESPFALVQTLCNIDHWVVYKTHEEVDGVERALDVRSVLDAQLVRRLKAERSRMQAPVMSGHDDAASSSRPAHRQRRAFCAGMPGVCHCVGCGVGVWYARCLPLCVCECVCTYTMHMHTYINTHKHTTTGGHTHQSCCYPWRHRLWSCGRCSRS